MPRRFFSSAAVTLLLVGLSACADEGGAPVPPSISIAMPSDGGGDAVPSDGGGEPVVSDGGGSAGSDGGSGAATPDVPPPNPDDYPHRDLRTPEGAEQTVRYYFALVFWGLETGDGSRAAELHSENCSSCDEVIAWIDEAREDRELWSDVQVDDIGTKVYDSKNFEHEVGYVFTLTASEGTFEDVDNLRDGKDYAAGAGVNWTGDRWSVGGVNFGEV